MNKVRIFSSLVGFLLALAGIALDNRPLVWAALVVLAVALALRLHARRRQSRPPSEPG